MPDDQDNRLLTQAAAGDTQAFRTLFEQHSAALFRLAYHLTGAIDAAEDVVQDCFLRLVRHPGRYDPRRGSLRQYLYGMVRNLVRQRWQAEGRLLALEDILLDDDPADAPLDTALQAEVSDAVQSAIAALPALQREAIVLFEFEGLSLEEVAAAAGCDAGTVKSRLYRARERLRRTLAPYGKGVSQ
ncbi:RNA polymerase, sigma-24 subunit, ECF subfamily [Candidatus Sulfopaludibacter sp. SbA4]|nr:RNA polymerase, sigma-24 subunit, ECF subfamily [Candidatus Sulfopaludibacter sp. SbA4]